MKNVKTILLFAGFLLLISCEKESLNKEEKEPSIATNTDDIKTNSDENTVLGNKVNNPYSLNNMKEAFVALGDNEKAKELKSNRIYVKLLPTTRQEVYSFLEEENENRFISEYPIDYEVIQYGGFYVDKEATDTILKPYYCVVISEADIPKVKYEVLDLGYVPNDDEEDVERLAWEIAGYKLSEENSDFLKKTNGLGYYPEGYVDVLGGFSSYIPVRSKSVMCNTFFKWSYMRTDVNGKFKSTVKFIVPALFYIRYWNPEYRIFGHALIDHLGSVKKSNMGSHWQINPSNKKSAWHKASLNNTFHDYNYYIVHGGPNQNKVNDVNFWFPITPSNSGASTVLMRKFGFWPHEITPADLSVAGAHDFGVYRWALTDYNALRRMMFHEFSHYTHAMIAGRAYWQAVCKAEGTNSLNTFSDPYRDGTKPSISAAAKLGFAEAWAEFAGLVVRVYFAELNGVEISYAENTSPKTIPFSANLYNSWIPTGLFWDLYDKSNETNQQNTVGQNNTKDCFTLNIAYLYSKLANAQTVVDYKNNLLLTTPSADKKCLTELFKAYGY